jgi:N,N'-diacetyllegionaminate synthase
MDYPTASVNNGNNTYVIAEAGVNHNGKLDIALKLADAAKEAGADAVKFQLYNAIEQISVNSPTASYQRLATGDKLMLDMAKNYDLPWYLHEKIANHCAEIEIDYMASCFDTDAIDFYRKLNGKVLKIASGEITNIELIQYACKTNLPIILSTGMSTLDEIKFTTELILNNSSAPLTLLHCVSRYPTQIQDLNLNFITTLKSVFSLPIGLSDHTQHLSVGGWATTLGATVIEKHMTLDKSLVGPDHAMSCSPAELKVYIKEIREAQIALGSHEKILTQEEISVRDVARRSVVASRDLEIGTIISPNDLLVKRPGNGISPLKKSDLIGKKLKKTINKDDQLTWDDF